MVNSLSVERTILETLHPKESLNDCDHSAPRILSVVRSSSCSTLLSEVDEEIEFIRKNKKNVSAIGEVGMDFKESDDKERQRDIFSKFIGIAIELDVPIIVHSRKAESECIEMLESFGAKKVVMHCFSGKMSLVKRIASNKWNLSIPTSVTRSEQFQNC